MWSWWQDGSVHRTPWPSATDVQALAAGVDAALVDDVAAVLTLVRKTKSEAKVSMRADISEATISATAAQAERVRTAADDIKAAGRINELHIVAGTRALDVQVTLAEA